MLVYLGAPKFYFFFHKSTTGLSFLLLFLGFANIRAKKLWELFSSPLAVFERSPEDFQTLGGIGAAHIQLLKS